MEIRAITIDTPDGGTMGGYLAIPDAGSGPGIVVLMEIFGVGAYITRAAERLAERATASTVRSSSTGAPRTSTSPSRRPKT